MAKRKQQRNEQIYQKWLSGFLLREIQNEFGITRQRVYQILKHKGVGEKEKVMRAVNRLSR